MDLASRFAWPEKPARMTLPVLNNGQKPRKCELLPGRDDLKSVPAMIVVGLTPRHLGTLTPRLSALAREGAMAPLQTVTPAVTCSVQASFMTGLTPREHGIVANGWLFRDLMEVMLWRQSNRLVEGEKLWEAAKRRDPAFTCANMFWWYNMASSHDFGATPRPIYKADGRKLPDCYTVPDSLRDRLTERPRTLSVVSILGARDHDSINALDCGCDQDSDGRE
jgi:hypothetical protein